jgi:uncharacterized repeat protein (TIGR03833 family)
MTGTSRAAIRQRARVLIVLKNDQASGRLTEGIVRDILTKLSTIRMASRSGWRAANRTGKGNFNLVR